MINNISPQNTYNIRTFAIDKNENISMIAQIGEEYDLWKLNKDNILSKWVKIKENCYSLFYDSEDNIYLNFDENGNESKNIYYIKKKANTLKKLEVTAGNHMGVSYNQKSNALFYTSIKSDSKELSIFKFNLTSRTEEKLFTSNRLPIYLLDSINNKNEYIYIKHRRNSYRTGHIHINGIDLPLIDDDKPHIVYDAMFHCGKNVLLTTDYNSDRSYLAYYDRTLKSIKKLLSIDKADIKYIYPNKCDKNLVYLKTLSGSKEALFEFDIANSSLKNLNSPVTSIQKVIIYKNYIYILGNSSDTPSNIFVYSNGTWINKTKFETNYKPKAAQNIVLDSKKGISFESLYYQDRGNRDNVILFLHGGPQASELDRFSDMYQFFIRNSYDVFIPNFRGSTGYGKKFMGLVERKWGDPIEDVLMSIDYLESKKYKNVILIGESYGGYLSLLTSCLYPHKIALAISLSGPTDLISLIKTVPTHWRNSLSKWIGNIEIDSDYLIKNSPITYIKNIKNPLMIVQGENDSRVRKETTDKFVELLKDNNHNYEYIVLKSEGHGFSSQKTEFRIYNRIIDFIKSNLKTHN